MLDHDTREQLSAYFQNLKKPVQFRASYGSSTHGQEMAEFLQQVVALSPLLSLETIDNPVTPSFTIGEPGQAARIRFSAIPMGHELTSFVLAVLWTGGHPPKIDESTLVQVRSLSEGNDYTVVMSLSCHNCPDVVQAFVLLAVFNPLFTVNVMDGALFQEEVERKGVLAVPAVFTGDTLFASGRMELKDVLNKLDTAGHQARLAQLSDLAPFDTLVIGAGPSGAAAAIYLARKGVRVAIIGERSGGQLNDTLGIENYPSAVETTGPRLSADLMSHVAANGVEIMNYPVTKLIPAEQIGGYHRIEVSQSVVLRTRSVIVATGARWRQANVPGEDTYRNKGVAYCPHCDGPLFKGKPVVVLGGGNSGVEAAIDLAGITQSVDLLEFADQLKADQVLVNKLQSLPNVRIHTMAQTTEIIGDGQRVTALRYQNRATQETHEITTDGVFVQIGLIPNSQWLETVVDRNRVGEILIDEKCATNVAGVFAAGDVTTVPYKQIVIAAGEGAKAALSAFDYLIRHAIPE